MQSTLVRSSNNNNRKLNLGSKQRMGCDLQKSNNLLDEVFKTQMKSFGHERRHLNKQNIKKNIKKTNDVRILLPHDRKYFQWKCNKRERRHKSAVNKEEKRFKVNTAGFIAGVHQI